MPLTAEGATNGMRLTLNGKDIAAADGVTLWTPQVGSYELTLADTAGKALDKVVFTVR